MNIIIKEIAERYHQYIQHQMMALDNLPESAPLMRKLAARCACLECRGAIAERIEELYFQKCFRNYQDESKDSQ